MKGRLCGLESWEAIKQGYNSIGLITSLSAAMNNYGDKKDAAHSIHLTHRDWFLLSQSEGGRNSSYFKRFISLVNMLDEHGGGGFGLHNNLIDQEFSGGATTAT